MTDPQQLAALEGQQYVVLRPTGAVAATYRSYANLMRSVLPAGTSGPNEGHLTLGGFEDRSRVADIRELVRDWAGRTAPLAVTTEPLETFPSPFQVVLLRAQGTGHLREAMASLRSAADRRAIRPAGNPIPIHEWVFHLSIAYCAGPPAEDWEPVREYVDGMPPATARREVVTAVELVWYENGEHSQVLPLTG